MRQRQTLGNRNVVGCNITRIREAKNIGQGELLRKIQLLGVDMNQAKLSRIEGQRIAIIDRDLIVIASALGVTADTLFQQIDDQGSTDLISGVGKPC